MTPDEAVRETIDLVFRKFAELGSARQVVAHLRDQSVALPHRDLRQGRISWLPADYAPVHRILTNPVYAGVYAYGRSKTEKHLDDQGRVRVRQKSRPTSEWQVLIEGHHHGFVSYEAFLLIQERLRSNWRAPLTESGGAVREGAALLQGLIRCGRCGRRMQVTYSGGHGKVRRYSCHQAHRMQAAEHACQSLGGVRLDQRVADAFLTVLEPASLEATIAALREGEKAWEVDRKQRLLMVEQARYQAERAKRQFDQVEPENRLVARTLEREWEARLAVVTEREHDLARFQTSRPNPLTAEEISWLRSAGADLRSVWGGETTTHRERKQLIRCLIKEVVVTVHRERSEADVTVVWAGGAATKLISKLNRTGEHHRATDDDVLDFVRRLAPQYTNEQIAFILNAKHLRTGHCNTFTARRVATLRLRLGIPSPKVTTPVDTSDASWMDVPLAARALGVSVDTIRRWAREGFLEARQVMPQAPWRIHITDDVRQRVVPDAPAGWLGLADTAKALGRSKQTILHWVQSGRLQAVQVTSGKRKGLRIELEKKPVGLFAGQ